jgi:hypothetical protein
MVIVPGKFIFACTPRAASRTVTTSLLTLPGATGRHTHEPPHELLAAKKEHGLPIVAIIRDPAAQLLSFWWNAYRCGRAGRYVVARTERQQGRTVHCRTVEFISFSTFIRSTWTGHFAFGENHKIRDRRLSCYYRVADEFFPLELGLEKFFEKWELPITEVPHETDSVADRRPKIDHNYLTEAHRRIVQEEFPEDVALYEQEIKRWTEVHK